MLESIKRGDITGMSFGFATISDTWDEVNGVPIRTLTEVRLYDVSPVTFPAYQATDVAVRSLNEFRAKRAPVQVNHAGVALDMLKRKLKLKEYTK